MGVAVIKRRDKPTFVRVQPQGSARIHQPSIHAGRTMKLLRSCALLLVLGSLLVASASADILKIVINDAIHPITAEYIGRALEFAAANHNQALLIEINTPGGFLDSTDQIIHEILIS